MKNSISLLSVAHDKEENLPRLQVVLLLWELNENVRIIWGQRECENHLGAQNKERLMSARKLKMLQNIFF